MSDLELMIEHVAGIDYEPADEEVGIMTPNWCVVMRDDKKRQICLNLGEKEIRQLKEAVEGL